MHKQALVPQLFRISYIDIFLPPNSFWAISLVKLRVVNPIYHYLRSPALSPYITNPDQLTFGHVHASKLFPTYFSVVFIHKSLKQT